MFTASETRLREENGDRSISAAPARRPGCSQLRGLGQDRQRPVHRRRSPRRGCRSSSGGGQGHPDQDHPVPVAEPGHPGCADHQPRGQGPASAPSPRSGRAEAPFGLEPPLAPGPRGTSPVGSPRRTSVGDADDFRAPLRLSEGVGGGKKYEQSLGRVAEIAFIGLGPPPLRGLTGGIQCRPVRIWPLLIQSHEKRRSFHHLDGAGLIL